MWDNDKKSQIKKTNTMGGKKLNEKLRATKGLDSISEDEES